MSLIVSYNAWSPSSCGVCWRVGLLVETGVEWVWCLRGWIRMVCVHSVPYRKLLFAILSINS